MKVVALVISILIGYVIGHVLLQGAVAAYASILISYHVYLVFLIVMAERKSGLSLQVGPTILTHSAFLALLIGLPYIRAKVPFFGLISLLMPGLAPFEANWLFGGERESVATHPSAAPPVPVETATFEDHEAFREHLKQGDRPFRKPGRTVDEEFSFWMADRARKKAEAAALGSPGAGSSRFQ
jgi:hypothetical protein